MNYYHYYAHGLDILSEISFPELTPSEKTDLPEDVIHIRLGDAPEFLDGFEFPSSKIQILPNHFLISLNDIADIYIHHGNEIIIQPAKGGRADTYRQYIIGFALGAALHQRGCLVLHGSSVSTPKGALAFVGDSGAGKSTLAAAFQAQGFSLLTDDLCHVDFNSKGMPQVYPGAAQIKLHGDSAQAISQDIHEGQRLPLYEEKYAFPLHKERDMSPISLYGVCEIIAENSEKLSFQILNKRKTLRLLLENTYSKRTLRFSGMRDMHFEHVSQTAGMINAGRLTRPSSDFCLAEMMDLILQEL